MSITRARMLATITVSTICAWQSPLLAGPTGYTFHSIVDTTSGAFTSFDFPTINNSGGVAFRGVLRNGQVGIFTGPNPATDAIVTATSSNPDDFRFFMMNNAGAVVFQQSFPDGSSGIFVNTKTSTRTVADTNANFSGFGFGTFDINDSGQVIFSAQLKSGVVGLYRGSNPATDTIADTNGAFSDNVGGLPPSSFGHPRINNSGKIVFNAGLKAIPGRVGIFTGPNPATDTIVDNAGPYIGVDEANLNNAGKVAFIADTGFRAEGIYTGPNPATDKFVDDSGPYAFLENQWLNDKGEIAFTAFAPFNGGGATPRVLYTGPDPIADRVIGGGDPLFGVNLTILAFGDEALNDRGQIAFAYELNDGRKGIAVATPNAAAIPLPSALPATLLLAGVFAARSTFRHLRASMR